MKKKIFTMFAAAALMLGMTDCTNEDNPAAPTTPDPIDVSVVEKELVGFWWDEFEYSGKTEDGKDFSRVILAVRIDEDKTGCLYLGLFDGASEDPLAIYGGFDDAGFSWKLLADGSLQLGDPVTGESLTLARAMTRADGGSYGSNMTNVSNTNVTYNNGTVTVTNGNYNGTLNKANETKANEIEQKLSTKIRSNVSLRSGGKAPEKFGEDDIR